LDLPIVLNSRPYATDDLPHVVDLLVSHIAAGHHFSVSVADLRQVLPRPSTESGNHSRVWETTQGEIVGFGLVWPPSNTVLSLVDPDLDEGAVTPPLSEQIIRWVVDHGHEIARACDGVTHLRFRPYEDDRALIALIEQYGFQAEDWHTPKYTRPLDDAVPEPRLPPGFTIRQVAGEQEVQEYVALHRDAFGTATMQVEERLAFMRDPDYLPELDLVVVAPDAVLAAFVVGGIDREESRFSGQLTGYTDPLGTRPSYRRQGLARALLYEALHRLRRHGVQIASVGTGSWNTATMRLVESVGFRLESKVLAYGREFR
jgi:mycothiol synthase